MFTQTSLVNGSDPTSRCHVCLMDEIFNTYQTVIISWQA
ncbi:hypothetical protein J542_3578 [Acinetobacter baumannii 299505]|nr:hypothetical protein J542_3578 [Acinetobacter baumannii 299505]